MTVYSTRSKSAHLCRITNVFAKSTAGAQLEGCPQVIHVLHSAHPCLDVDVWENWSIKRLWGAYVVERPMSGALFMACAFTSSMWILAPL
jgi:hypothetical protein